MKDERTTASRRRKYRNYQQRHVDDIQAVLNPVQAASLECALALLPSKRRIHIAMAMAGMTSAGELIAACGLSRDESNAIEVSVLRWLRGDIRMPMGMGFRIARVFGVSAEVLCEGYV